jgi:chromate transporter
MSTTADPATPWRVFVTFLRLGLTSFGGPTAHLGYFRDELVRRRGWVDDATFADLVALCQALPGPASSQLGIALGTLRAGRAGGLAAFLGFTLPSAALMVAAALGLAALPGDATAIVHGLEIVALVVVTTAVWGMARSLAPDVPRGSLAVLSAAMLLVWPGPWSQLVVLGLAAVVGRWLPGDAVPEAGAALVPGARREGLVMLGLAALLLGLALVAPLIGPAEPLLAIGAATIRAGALVFGGGHVVLPLLQESFVTPGLLDRATFVAGYGLAQALPGPLFSFAAYLGASTLPGPLAGWGALVAVCGIFAPGYLLVIGALPFWQHLRRHDATRAALRGVNAAVVGLLLATWYQPVWLGAIREPSDLALALIGWAALAWWRVPAWALVLIAIVAGLVASAGG